MAGDGYRQLARELVEVVRASHEIGLAVELEEHAKPRAMVDVAADDALAHLSVGLLCGCREALLAEPVSGLFEVSPALLERSLAVHDAGAGLLTQPLDVLGLDHGRGHGSFLGFAGPAARVAPSAGIGGLFFERAFLVLTARLRGSARPCPSFLVLVMEGDDNPRTMGDGVAPLDRARHRIGVADVRGHERHVLGQTGRASSR